MKRYIVLDKKRGETPLAALTAYKAAHPEYAETPASYAGRLDPMAEGKLPILLGDECKKQKKYTGLDKEYEVEVLLDVGSDTGDALGIVRTSRKETRIDMNVLRSVLIKEHGAHMRPYPAYSSKVVDGKPLFLYALEGNLEAISIPEHKEQIFKTSIVTIERLSFKDLQARIAEFLADVPKTDEPSKALGADFRINDVRASWEQVFKSEAREFTIIRLRVVCGSGTYMRSLAGRMGEALGTNALALSIKRTKIGRYWNRFWLKLY